jgi:hypothetical protein
VRKPLLALSLALALVLPVACGGDDDDVDAASDDKTEKESSGDESDLRALMISSAEKAAENSSYRFEGKVGVPMGDQTIDMVMTGMADNSKPVMVMDMDMGAIPGLPAGDTKMSMILDGEVFYMKWPASMAQGMGLDMGGRSWAKIDLAALGAKGEAFEGLLTQAKQADPAAYVSLMAGATDDITEVGTEEVRGTKTRHFKMTVDTAAVYEGASPELKEASKSFVDQYGSNAKLPVEVWIGDDDLPRKISMTIDTSTIPDAQALGTGTIVTTIEMFDYGVTVDAAVPPAEDTFDFAELVGTPPQ